MQTTNLFIEKSPSGIPSEGYQYSYVLNNPLKYTDPSGYKKLNQYKMEELRVNEGVYAEMVVEWDEYKAGLGTG